MTIRREGVICLFAARRRAAANNVYLYTELGVLTSQQLLAPLPTRLCLAVGSAAGTTG